MTTTTITSDLTIASGQVLNFTNERAFFFHASGSDASLFLNGSVTVHATTVSGIFGAYCDSQQMYKNSVFDIGASGSFSVLSDAANGTATGYTSISWAPAFQNSGTFSVTSIYGAAYGVTSMTLAHTFDNDGTFTVTGATTAFGVGLAGGAHYTNTGSMVVSGQAGATAMQLTAFDVVDNSGLISAATDTGGPESVAIRVSFPFDTVINNSGTIQADIAIDASAYDTPQNITVTNTGTISGEIVLSLGADKVTNSGAIAGNVDLRDANDTFDGGLGHVDGSVYGGVGDDSLTGGDQNDVLVGDEAMQSADDGNDNLNGGAGDDVLLGQGGNDTLDGGAGVDTASYASASTGVMVDLSLNAAQNTGGAGTDTLTDIESLTGSPFADTLGGGVGDNRLDGGAGDDHLTGGAGNDTLDGGAGTDTADYGLETAAIAASLVANTASGTTIGNDTLVAIENLIGGSGDDTLTGNASANFLSGGDGNDTLADSGAGDTFDGGAGIDTANFAAVASAITVNLATGAATIGAGSDILVAIENLSGGAGNDSLTGNSGANALNGGDGNDTIDGGAGNDVLDGGNGTDTASYASDSSGVTASLTKGIANGASSGSDTLLNFEDLVGSAGNDSLTGDSAGNALSGGKGSDTLDGGAGNDTLDGGVGTDTASFAGDTAGLVASLATGTASGGAIGSDTLTSVENLIGGAGNDILTGNAAANSLSGGSGNDTLDGGAGNDTLVAGAGTDTLSGGGGDDLLDFGSFFTAADHADGGLGVDTLVLNGDYSSLLTFAAATMTGVEILSLKDGFSYQLRVGDANVAAGQMLTVDGSHLDTTFSLVFRGSGEADGTFTINGGKGDDSLTGGKGDDVIKGAGGDDGIDCTSGGNDTVYGNNGNDIFHFAGSFTAADSVDGGGSAGDTLHLNGDYSAGVVFIATTVQGVALFRLDSGNSYALSTVDQTVAAAKTLTVDASKLGAANFVNFNGSAETDGTLVLLGGAGGDTLTGGAGSDTLRGSFGADVLTGGAGADVFVVKGVAEFIGSSYDTLIDFDFTADHLDVARTLKAIGTEVTGATLSQATLDSDLAAILDAGHLHARNAVLVDAASGTLAGHILLVVDANNVAGYQAGADYVFDVTTASNLASLDKGDFF